jgi:selenocysteine lyase/cysteine desulfurase
MKLNRRSALGLMGAGSLAASFSGVAAFGAESAPRAPETPVTLPDKARFPIRGTHLNAAFIHPFGTHCQAAAREFFDTRANEPNKSWPVENSRQEVVEAFGGLIGASSDEIAVVPSTLVGENLVAESLRLGPGRGVVTDPFHYDASLAMYGERHKRGMPLTVLPPRDHRIDYDELRRAITPEIGLVAISWVSSWTGLTHDLKAVCDIAHEKGVPVYADVIQGVGALPLDVQATGIDFCCAGAYKWLMGNFGVAFLYVRASRLASLQRVQLGWRGLTSFVPHFLPYDTPGPTGGDWSVGDSTAQIFEVSTPDWCDLRIAKTSIDYIRSIGVSEILRHRTPLLERLQVELPRLGFEPLTPREHQGPSVVFACRDARERFARRLEAAKTYVSVGKNRIRVSASVYNDEEDIARLIHVLKS